MPDSLHTEPQPQDDDSLGRAGSALLSVPPEAPAPERLGAVPVTAILRALSQLLVEKGVVTREELAERIQAVSSSGEAL